ncbi:MAG: hypothetical protein ACRC8S_14745 [Fimbriiglobus sp.]
MPAEQPPEAPVAQEFPGGIEARPYRWAFAVWVVMFLMLLCFGFLNFIGLLIHHNR